MARPAGRLEHRGGWHVRRGVRGKDEILLGPAERLRAEALDGFAPAVAWRETLESPARRVRTAWLARPRIALLVASRGSRRSAELRGADAAIGAPRQAGLGGRDAARPNTQAP
ncbi:TetR/AcrR family transcriptional regulator C-terminal domain-containing protein [Streptomyces seoulensis]|nr:TetR/AcrR family transcriptional regulator C-terminal domain-containing protein [Streptomyces seoulensis]